MNYSSTSFFSVYLSNKFSNFEQKDLNDIVNAYCYSKRRKLWNKNSQGVRNKLSKHVKKGNTDKEKGNEKEKGAKKNEGISIREKDKMKKKKTERVVTKAKSSLKKHSPFKRNSPFKSSLSANRFTITSTPKRKISSSLAGNNREGNKERKGEKKKGEKKKDGERVKGLGRKKEFEKRKEDHKKKAGENTETVRHTTGGKRPKSAEVSDICIKLTFICQLYHVHQVIHLFMIF